VYDALANQEGSGEFESDVIDINDMKLFLINNSIISSILKSRVSNNSETGTPKVRDGYEGISTRKSAVMTLFKKIPDSADRLAG
jgi:hypothetical protein